MADATPHTVRDNIQTIIRLEEQQDNERSLGDRIGDTIGTFAGTITFVALHLTLFMAWAVVNRGMIPGIPAFDPYPFSLLTMIVSLEGVLITTFVLIKQNRMGVRADRRNQLDLQIKLLTEKEVTKVVQMLERIAAHLKIEQQVADAETRELGEVTAVGELAKELKQALPEEA